MEFKFDNSNPGSVNDLDIGLSMKNSHNIVYSFNPVFKLEYHYQFLLISSSAFFYLNCVLPCSYPSRGDFVVLHVRTTIKQHRAFSIVGPSAWNGLPSELRSLPWDLSSSLQAL